MKNKKSPPRPQKKSASAQSKNDVSRSRISQSDFPAFSLEQAIRIPRALSDHFAGSPTQPLFVAKALNSQPNSGPFRTLTGAAIAYGLTDGGWNASEIKLTDLGRRIVRPLAEGDDASAMREALLRPRVIGDFIRKYDGSPLPREDIAQNVLHDMGVPSDRTKEVLSLIIEGAESVKLIQHIKDKKYVSLQQHPHTTQNHQPEQSTDKPNASSFENKPIEVDEVQTYSPTTNTSDSRKKKVFITHGKDKSFVEPIKKLLQFGEMEAVISVEKQSVSQPVPDKVMNEMRSCGAAIIHVNAESKVIDQDANEHVVLNPNVLIEIGAAMALYGRRFILLVRDGIMLPSNLQGLYEVRYTGESLDGAATIKLLEAINELKKLELVTSI